MRRIFGLTLLILSLYWPVFAAELYSINFDSCNDWSLNDNDAVYPNCGCEFYSCNADETSDDGTPDLAIGAAYGRSGKGFRIFNWGDSGGVGGDSNLLDPTLWSGQTIIYLRTYFRYNFETHDSYAKLYRFYTSDSQQRFIFETYNSGDWGDKTAFQLVSSGDGYARHPNLNWFLEDNYTADTWLCVEFLIDQTNDEWILWIDGEQIGTAISLPDTSYSVTGMAIGGNQVGQGTGTDHFFDYDDIVVATTYIGPLGGDTTPPVVTGYDPAKSETDVAKDTNIEFIVYDADNDVDLDTIVMTEENNYHCCTGMTGTCPGSGTKDLTCTDYSVLGDGYTVVYNPGVDYSYEQVVNVTIDADDTEANSMTQDVYSFTIESEPQTALTILKGSGNAWRFNGKRWVLE